jgi:hypothetical protein
MAVLAPLAHPESDPRLSSRGQPGLRWWLLWDSSLGALTETLAELMARLGAPDARWSVVLSGHRDRVRYVAAAVDDAPAPRAQGGSSTVELAAVASADLAALLDRAETAPVGAEMSLLSHGDGSGVATGSAQAAVVLSQAGAPWAVVALAGQPPAVPGIALLATPQPMPPAPPPTSHGPPRGWMRRGAVVAVAVAASVAAAAVLLAVRQQSPADHVTSPFSPRATLPSGIAHTLPMPAYQPSFAFDADRRQVVMFGGGDPAAGTWLWVDRGWQPADPSSSPLDRFGSAAAYDPEMKRVMLFGGRLTDGTVVNDTWVWDGASWARLATSGQGSGPPGWEFSGMAWDEARREMVLLTPPNVGFAGGSSLTWTWGGHSWVRRQSAQDPPAEPSTAMAFDPTTRSVLLVLGGLSPGAAPSTWSWDGTTWHQLHPVHQPGLGGFTSFLARIPNGPQLILARLGIDSPQVVETWSWDGRDWTRENTAVVPTGIVGLVSATDRGVVAVGRVRRDLPLSTWLWTGADWTPV